MSEPNKSTRDLCIETNTMLRDYIKASTERREICGALLADKEKRIRSLEEQAAMAKGGWRTLVTVGACGGAIGAFLTKLSKL